MKKTFPFSLPGKDRQRVIESIKGEIRKYLKRERRKPLPAAVDFWDFDCKVGSDQVTAEPKHIEEVIDAVDGAAAAGASQVYVEILAKVGRRTKRPAVMQPATEESHSAPSKAKEDTEQTPGFPAE
ncbi:MAG TPA: DUF6172 family protein [Lacunisphaera sp.]|jgi:hypothetical protein